MIFSETKASATTPRDATLVRVLWAVVAVCLSVNFALYLMDMSSFSFMAARAIGMPLLMVATLAVNRGRWALGIALFITGALVTFLPVMAAHG
jgi:hypothetical protein